MQKLMEEIEKYGFECEAGPLTLCIPCQKLKQMAVEIRKEAANANHN